MLDLREKENCHMLGPYENPEVLKATLISSVCHGSGAAIEMELRGGQVVRTSHSQFVVCFTKPLREWYRDLVDT